MRSLFKGFISWGSGEAEAACASLKHIVHDLQSSVWVHAGTGRAAACVKQKVMFQLSIPPWLLFKLYIRGITGVLLHYAQLCSKPDSEEHSIWQPLLADTTTDMASGLISTLPDCMPLPFCKWFYFSLLKPQFVGEEGRHWFNSLPFKKNNIFATASDIWALLEWVERNSPAGESEIDPGESVWEWKQ